MLANIKKTSDAIPYKIEFKKYDISTKIAIFTTSEDIKINLDDAKKFSIFFIFPYSILLYIVYHIFFIQSKIWIQLHYCCDNIFSLLSFARSFRLYSFPIA